jgi:hypothetical protein
MSSDGVHLTPLGYELLWKEMSDIILTKFKGRGLDYTDFDDLPQRAPWCVSRSKATQPRSTLTLRWTNVIGTIRKISPRYSNTHRSANKRVSSGTDLDACFTAPWSIASIQIMVDHDERKGACFMPSTTLLG